MPADGYPIAGFDERAAGVYVLVTHSAVTLAPLLGQLAANEIVDGASVELLAPYRLARFGSGA
jgi:glycine/D-amino acid oxidase-like deaminating enzyme